MDVLLSAIFKSAMRITRIYVYACAFNLFLVYIYLFIDQRGPSIPVSFTAAATTEKSLLVTMHFIRPFCHFMTILVRVFLFTRTVVGIYFSFSFLLFCKVIHFIEVASIDK